VVVAKKVKKRSPARKGKAGGKKKEGGDRARKKPRTAARPSTAVERPSPEEEAAFTEALILSGEAACLDEDGKLPKGATHKIEETPGGNVKVTRRRYSIT
jgi:hypothetical protein